MPKILLTGATGFIGGSILTHLVDSSSSHITSVPISCILRGQHRADKLKSTYGDRVHPILYDGIDDLETTTAAAAEHDVVINTTLGYHDASAQALLQGLSQRKSETRSEVWFIHTSGTSNLADQPISEKWNAEDRNFDDAKDDVYGYEKEREKVHSYTQRSVELGVVDTGLALGVQTLVIMSPTIYGCGSGLFNKISVQIPSYIRTALEYGRAIIIGEGKGVWGHVHVDDLADLYVIALLDILESGGKKLPTGKKCIIFSENGHHSWLEVARGVADCAYEQGHLSSKQVESVTLAEGTRLFSSYLGTTDEDMVELGLCSNSRTASTIARSLGWKPSRNEEAWREGFRDDVRAVVEKQKT